MLTKFRRVHQPAGLCSPVAASVAAIKTDFASLSAGRTRGRMGDGGAARLSERGSCRSVGPVTSCCREIRGQPGENGKRCDDSRSGLFERHPRR